MLDLFSIYRPLSTVNGQTVTTYHYGRDIGSLPFYGINSPEGGYNLAGDYYTSFGETSFLKNTYHPYFDAQRAANPDWVAATDPDLPRPSQGQAEQVVAKYEQLSGLTHNGLLNANDLLVGGVMAELHPYWERMLIDTTLQELATTSERQQLDAHYMQNGISTVQSILDTPAYTSSTTVQFACAQSTAFLQLSEADKVAFTGMALADQWELIYIEPTSRTAFIASADKPQQGNATSSHAAYSSPIIGLSADKKAMDLDAVLARFEALRSSSGRDFEAEFEQVFQQQTQQLDFNSVATELKGVYQLYSGVLNRTPDQSGFEYWLKDYNSGNTLEEIAVGFTGSIEFQNQLGNAPGQQATIDQILSALYQVVLGRTADADGLAWWKDQYENNGYTLGNVVTGFTWSDEYESKVDEQTHAWLAATYGPNLLQLDYAGLGFSQSDIDAIQPVGVYDLNANDGYEGIVL